MNENFSDLHSADWDCRANDLKAKAPEEIETDHLPTYVGQFRIFLLITITFLDGSSGMEGPKYGFIETSVDDREQNEIKVVFEG
jgi:hypothetical protein